MRAVAGSVASRAAISAAICTPDEPAPTTRTPPAGRAAGFLYPVEWIYDADNRPCCTAFEDAGAPDGLSVVDDRTADLFGGDR